MNVQIAYIFLMVQDYETLLGSRYRTFIIRKKLTLDESPDRVENDGL